jgi:hypothetical protein
MGEGQTTFEQHEILQKRTMRTRVIIIIYYFTLFGFMTNVVESTVLQMLNVLSYCCIR